MIKTNKIKVGAVSYLNTKPLLYGLYKSSLIQQIKLVEEYPSKIAEDLLNGNIDLGLVPVAIIPQLSQYYIISEYCIGCDGEVASVALFSDVPIYKIENLLLDYQSKTSVMLTKILLKYFWKINPLLVPANEHFIDNIKGSTAALIIGDRAFEQRSKYKYIYDLGSAWKQYSGLPFVFAAWIANKPLPSEFMNAFSKANAQGLNHLEEIVASLNYPHYNLKQYYTKNIQFKLGENMLNGLNKFLDILKQEPI